MYAQTAASTHVNGCPSKLAGKEPESMSTESTTKIQMVVTVEMTEQQVRDYAADYGVAPENVPADVRSYVQNNLRAVSSASEDYWASVSVGPA